MHIEVSTEYLSLKNDFPEKPRLWPSYRLAVTGLVFWGIFSSVVSQGSMGAAMGCMVHESLSGNNTTGLDWGKRAQSWVHSSRFLAYYLTQLPSAQMMALIGAKAMTAIGAIILGICDILTVPCVNNMTALLVVRFLQGAANVMILTGCFNVAGRWTPREESALLMAISGTGLFAGGSVAFTFASYACSASGVGWPVVFFLSGGMVLLFFVGWIVFASEGPGRSRWVGKEENDYVISCLEQQGTFRGKIPWGPMLRCGPLYAIALAQIGSDWLQFFFLTVAPEFFIDLMDFSSDKTGLVCGVPFFVAIPISVMYGRFSDFLREKGVLSTVGARRLSQALGNVVPAICCTAIALLPLSRGSDSTTNVNAAVALFGVCVVAATANTAGWVVNVSDLAPQLSGVVLTVSQTLALWTSFVVPIVVDYVTVDKTEGQWDIVFYTTAALQVVCFSGFSVLASGEVQPWAVPEEPNYSVLPTTDEAPE